MSTKNERPTVLSEAEQFASYGLPDFDDAQRMQTFLTPKGNWRSYSAVWALRPRYIALCKSVISKPSSFSSSFLGRNGERLRFHYVALFQRAGVYPPCPTKHEVYKERNLIAALFGYRSWFIRFLPKLAQKADQVVRRDIIPAFIVAEFKAYVNEQKIVRPGSIRPCRRSSAKCSSANAGA